MNKGEIWLDLYDGNGEKVDSIAGVAVVPRVGEEIVDLDKRCTYRVMAVTYLWGEKSVIAGYAQSRSFSVRVRVA